MKGVWIYTLLLWVYIVADMFVFPQYQFSGISRLIPVPQNLIGDMAFPISFFAFVLWEYLKKVDTDGISESGSKYDPLKNSKEIPR